MTDILPDTLRRLYTDPGEYIDSDHPAVMQFAEASAPPDASDRDKASRLYTAVRDGIRYDGHSDALLHPFDGAGRTYMQYVTDHGSFHDVPAKFLMREMARDYANMQGEDLSGRDMEREAAQG